ncbi:MAG: DnaJ domain-containing protein [Dehalococcoidia bacterium]
MKESPPPTARDEQLERLTERRFSSDGPEQEASDAYFDTMGKLQEAVKNRDYAAAARLNREHMKQVPGLVKSQKRYGSFQIQSIPALGVGGTMLALAGDRAGLSEMRNLVASLPELEPWKDAPAQFAEDLELFQVIRKTIGENPGVKQTEMKGRVGEEDGRRVATLISWLDKGGEILRKKKGSTYLLYTSGEEVEAGQGPAAPTPPPREVRTHRAEPRAMRALEVNIESIPYVPLPRSPEKWKKPPKLDAAKESFEIRDTEEWTIESVEKIPMDERPDPAFRQMHSLRTGLTALDDLGNAEFPSGPVLAAALHYGRTGEIEAKKPLLHDIYRVGVNPMGEGIILMSREGVVHAYDDAFNLRFETTIADSPEMRALRKRFDIEDHELKNHIRCVALSRDGNRYLVTAIDEAWCVDREGRGLWAAKLPIKESWERVATPGASSGTSAEIEQALSLMDMPFPFTPEDMKGRYRELAKQWHPDVNPNDPSATERMQQLTAAVKLLTGIDEKDLPGYTGVAYYAQAGTSTSTTFEVPGGTITLMTSGLMVSEKYAADWIYAASFAGSSDSVFLAGYSGRVIEMSSEGRAIRAYDIGAVPRRIVDTGDYLYILTDTRLYVLKDDALYAIIDTFGNGDLVATQNGFGIIEKKRFRWFRENGTLLGSVVTRAPLRRVYASHGGMTAETRTERAYIAGTPAWWND